MKESPKTNSKVTIHLTVEDDPFPTALEIDAPLEQIVAHLKELKECRDVSFREKPLLIPDKNGLKRIPEADLLYIEADRSYCFFHFLTGGKQLVASPMKTFEDYFRNKGFVRIHKSYIANIRYIDFIKGDTITFFEGTELNIGNNYKKRVFSHFTIEGTKSHKYI